MSRTLNDRKLSSIESSKKIVNKEEVKNSISNLNTRLEHLATAVLPKEPYLLSVPSEVPYRHSTRFVSTWHVGTPFKNEEEQLQYLSFLPHQGDHEDLLSVVGEWADELGQATIEEDEELSGKRSVAQDSRTFTNSGNRKKISLKDYKTKDKVISQSTSIEEEEERQGTTNTLPPNGLQRSPKPNATPISRSESKGDYLDVPKESLPKGPERMEGRTSSHGGTASPSLRHNDRDLSPRPNKRRNLSPTRAKVEEDTAQPQAKVKDPGSKTMPKLLSPTLPSPERETGLPELLSPLLPPTLASAIITPPRSSSTEDNHQHRRTESVRSILANVAREDSPRRNDKNPSAADGRIDSRVRSDSQHSIRSNASGNDITAKTQSPAKAGSKPSLLGTPLQNSTRSSPGPRQRHTIILKYGKKNRKRVEALLKFASRPKKAAVRLEASNSASVQEGKQKSTSEEALRSDKMRVLESSPKLATKKGKALAASNEKRPATPLTNGAVTPQTNNVSSSRGNFSTPKKELKASAMRRVESSEGGEATTPAAEKPRVSTPVSVDRGSKQPKQSPASSSVSSNREEDRAAWTEIKSKYFELGRTIKHHGTSLVPTPSRNNNEKDAARSVVLLVEALLCFIINTAAQAYSRTGADPGWATILPYHIYVFRASRKFPHLHGLVIQLGAVCRQFIHRYDMDRLARDPLPEEQCNSAPTPGSDGNTKNVEDAEKYKKRYIEFRDSLVQNARELQTAWLDGSRILSLDVLEREYPETWSKRTKDANLRIVDRPIPSKISKDYFLPLDANTTAFQAVRFTLAFLEEWTKKENVDWNTKIEL